jgi:hypothetical protein
VIEAIASRLGFDVPGEIRHSGRVPMFRTYVRAMSGTVVDFDRASLLTDRELLDEAFAALEHERTITADRDTAEDAQWVWSNYCQRHRNRYGTPFGPGIIPGWDHPSQPDPLARPQESMPSGSSRFSAQDRKPHT